MKTFCQSRSAIYGKKKLVLIDDIDSINGSVRKMINSVEKCFVYDKNISLSNCEKLCSTISFKHFDNYYNFLLKNDVKEATKILYEIYDYGYSVIDILDFLFYYTKKTELIEEHIKYEVIILLCKYITIFHNIHEDCVELALITNNINKVFS